MEFVLGIERWVHLLSGVTWIGLLYYFNFIQVPAIAAANADKGGPGRPRSTNTSRRKRCSGFAGVQS